MSKSVKKSDEKKKFIVREEQKNGLKLKISLINEENSMPKRDIPSPTKTRPHPRRAASKEALKQMHLILDDEAETLEVPNEDASKVDEFSAPSPPKKKYKITHRKSSDDREVLVFKSITNHNVENTLDLECWREELSAEQLAKREKYVEEEKEIKKQFENLVQNAKAEIIFKGDYTTIYEVCEQIKNNIQAVQQAPQAAPPNLVLNSAVNQNYQVLLDSRLGLIMTGPVATSPPAAPKPPRKPFTKKIQVAQNLQATPTTTVPNPAATRPKRNVITTPVLRQISTTTPTRLTRAVQEKPTKMSAIKCEIVGCIKPKPPMFPFPLEEKLRSKWIQSCGNAVLYSLKGPEFEGKKVCCKHFPSSDRVTKFSVPCIGIHTKVRNDPNTTKGVTRKTVVDNSLPTKSPSNLKPSESNVEGGLTTGAKSKNVVDLTGTDRSIPDSREISFNKLQGKTYPSLVVVARAHLRATDPSVDRGKLDSRVKSVLMHAPTKFTEWLIQQGLVKSEQKCSCLLNTPLKLGMYSDVTKFPHSGGYVWISDCCPHKFVSVFSGSIFEGSPHPPLVILKLLYHWACQTNIQNVTQWVKVDNLYVKTVYTWLRSICTVALHTHLVKLGGPGVKVEVGVISLGTTTQDGSQRQVKVEVLGILETNCKLIRLRAVQPLRDNERNYKQRFSKILEPILQWIHPESTIVTDLTVDRTTLNSMGFHNVVQSSNNEYGINNKTIMEYLRKIVPRMFQNTLSLLSRQIIQQFLDELVWREWYGNNANQAFDNLLKHLAEQTKHEADQTLLVQLNRVLYNPFKNWSLKLKKSAPTNTVSTVKVPEKKYQKKKVEAPKVQNTLPELTRPISPDIPEQLVPLENYYYGTIHNYLPTNNNVNLNIRCPFCKEVFNNNLLLMNHLFKHAHNASMDAQLCRYCLASVPSSNDMAKHLTNAHPGETKFDNGFVCLICETHFMNPFILGKHMSKEHFPSELPYQCGNCIYRCSNHKQIIDHFYKSHDNGPGIQCPFCLKSTTIYSSSRNIVQNVNFFIKHLQKHQKKQIAKRCGKCNLWFINKEEFKNHQIKMHCSQRGKNGLIPWSAPRNGVMVPKSKMDTNPGDAEIINFTTLYFNVSKTAMCKECNTPMGSAKHFPSFESCQNPNCQYSTCCTNAMQEHNAKCSKQTEFVAAPSPLSTEMFCVCGFKSKDGHILAKHLAICERKSAYPTLEDAKQACVTHSMLDVLGLVRKPEENALDKNKEPQTSNEKPKENESDDDVIRLSSPPVDTVEILDDDDDVVESEPPKKKSKTNTEEVKSTEKENANNTRRSSRREKSFKVGEDS